jgi:hypothetical protein
LWIAYYERKRLDIFARSKKWAENNPEKVRRAKTNNLRIRRAARHASRGNFTVQEFKELCARYGTNVWLAAIPKLYWRLTMSCL